MKKGVVMEVDDRFLTLLTPDGQFLRARKQDKSYNLGEEIVFFPIEVNEKERKNLFSLKNLIGRRSIALGSAAFILFFTMILPLSNSNEVYAYMSIDVNPSIELGVNSDLEVVELNAFNNEGKEIIAKVSDWENEDMTVIADKIINEIKNRGYFEENGDILISTIPIEKEENEIEVQMDKKVAAIKNHIDEKEVTLTVMEGTEKEREEAKKLGLSTGKYKNQHQEKTPEKVQKDKKISPVIEKKSEPEIVPQPEVNPPVVPPTVGKDASKKAINETPKKESHGSNKNAHVKQGQEKKKHENENQEDDDKNKRENPVTKKEEKKQNDHHDLEKKKEHKNGEIRSDNKKSHKNDYKDEDEDEDEENDRHQDEDINGEKDKRKSGH